MLGAATMRSIGARPGGLVGVIVTDPGGARHKAQFCVVGRASLPPSFGTGGLGSGAAITLSALTNAQCPPGAGRHACQRHVQRGTIYSILARAAPGQAAAAVDVLLVTMLAIGVLVAANVLAFFPALLAARSRPARLLRAE